ncbi:MAG: PIN domain-containing protein [Planctomycetes bacterium]|nr:PIN domain-containing protein [Planctomycetota bacterium]
MIDTVFLDTVGLLALWNRRDQWHSKAKLAFSEIVASRHRLVTTSYVLMECGNAASRHPFRKLVAALREELLAGGNLLDPTQEEIDETWHSYARGGSGQAGIVDHLSFCVMRREGISLVFSSDNHFHDAGFKTLF